MSSNESERNGDNNNVILELTEQLQKEGIVISFVYNKKVNSLILSLNHIYDNKTIISPILNTNWPKTSETFAKNLKHKRVKENHISQLCDVLDNNYEKVLDLNSSDNSNNEDQQQKKIYYIRKYTANNTLPLHESIVINMT